MLSATYCLMQSVKERRKRQREETESKEKRVLRLQTLYSQSCKLLPDTKWPQIWWPYLVEVARILCEHPKVVSELIPSILSFLVDDKTIDTLFLKVASREIDGNGGLYYIGNDLKLMEFVPDWCHDHEFFTETCGRRLIKQSCLRIAALNPFFEWLPSETKGIDTEDEKDEEDAHFSNRLASLFMTHEFYLLQQIRDANPLKHLVETPDSDDFPHVSVLGLTRLMGKTFPCDTAAVEEAKTWLAEVEWRQKQLDGVIELFETPEEKKWLYVLASDHTKTFAQPGLLQNRMGVRRLLVHKLETRPPFQSTNHSVESVMGMIMCNCAIK